MTPRHETATPTPSEVLIGQLGLTRRTQAEVQDLYSRALREHITAITPMAPAAPTARAAVAPGLEAA